MTQNVLHQHVVNTLRSLRTLAVESGDLSVRFVLDTALSSLDAAPAEAPATPALTPTQDWEWDTDTVARREDQTTRNLRDFARAQGLSEAQIASLTPPVDEDGEYLDGNEGYQAPVAAGNIIDDEGRATGETLGDAETFIQTANSALEDQAEDEEDDPYADARSITLLYARLDGEELTEDDINTILNADASAALKEVMGEYRVIRTLAQENPAEREVMLQFDASDDKLKPGALLHRIAVYQGVTAIPGLGAVSVRPVIPDWI